MLLLNLTSGGGKWGEKWFDSRDKSWMKLRADVGARRSRGTSRTPSCPPLCLFFSVVIGSRRSHRRRLSSHDFRDVVALLHRRFEHGRGGMRSKGGHLGGPVENAGVVGRGCQRDSEGWGLRHSAANTMDLLARQVRGNAVISPLSAPAVRVTSQFHLRSENRRRSDVGEIATLSSLSVYNSLARWKLI